LPMSPLASPTAPATSAVWMHVFEERGIANLHRPSPRLHFPSQFASAIGEDVFVNSSLVRGKNVCAYGYWSQSCFGCLQFVGITAN
jgi:hypothetical protein